jgi:myo-inositol-1(or 4)-monophosphatase
MNDTQRGTDLDLDTLRDDLEDAVRAACEAIRAVMDRGTVRVGHKWGEGPVTEADHAADDVLHSRLLPLIPGAHWLSEESEQSDPLVRGEPTWVVDPLDGTREFLRGLPEFGVSVGLFADDRLVLGAAGLPAEEDAVLYTGLLDGERREARRDGAPLPALDGSEDAALGRIVVSRWDYEHRRLHYHIPHEVYPLGSAVVKLVHAATGDAGVYLSTGPRSVWDAAGGAAVLAAVGGTMLQIDGSPLRLSPQQIEIPPFVAGAPARGRALLRSLGADL